LTRHTTESAEPLSSHSAHKAGESPPPDGAGQSPKPNSSEVSALETELATVRDRWMRSEAEIANVRNRAKRDVEDAKKYAVQKFASDVVEAAENLRRGLLSVPPAYDGEPPILAKLRAGFLGVENSFLGLLERNGIVREDPLGTAFDPQRHEAMSQAESSSAPGTVLQAMSSAWTLNGRLLRPAMVVVAKAPAASPTEMKSPAPQAQS